MWQRQQQLYQQRARSRQSVERRNDFNLNPVAQDVKAQIEFNPARVQEWRQIDYENRQLNREDFNNDAVDAGDIGAGKRVTVLYELTLTGQKTSVDRCVIKRATVFPYRRRSTSAWMNWRFSKCAGKNPTPARSPTWRLSRPAASRRLRNRVAKANLWAR